MDIRKETFENRTGRPVESSSACLSRCVIVGECVKWSEENSLKW